MLKELSNSKFLIPTMVILAILAAASGFYVSVKQSKMNANSTAEEYHNIEGLFWPNPKQIMDFNTLDHNNQEFSLAQMKGKWSLIFFGYTHCPDICPITMSVMNDTFKKMGTESNDVQVIFVSVDPARDSIEKLNQYVSYFNEEFIALGGTKQQVDSLTKQIGVAYYINQETTEAGYLVDHTASIFIFDSKARLVGKLSAPHDASNVMKKFTQIKNFINAKN